jgi:hypothetical protein
MLPPPLFFLSSAPPGGIAGSYYISESVSMKIKFGDWHCGFFDTKPGCCLGSACGGMTIPECFCCAPEPGTPLNATFMSRHFQYPLDEPIRESSLFLSNQPQPGGAEKIENDPSFMGAPFLHHFPQAFLRDSSAGAQIFSHKILDSQVASGHHFGSAQPSS